MRPPPELTDSARDDLRNIGDWLRQPGAGRTARRRLASISQTIESLGDYPNRGRRIGAGPLRTIVAQRHRILYTVVQGSKGETVLIVRILGPGQTL